MTNTTLLNLILPRLEPRRPHQAIVLQYEELMTQRAATLERLAHFLGVALSTAQLAAAVARSSPEFEARNHRLGYPSRQGLPSRCPGVPFLNDRDHTPGLSANESAKLRRQMRARLTALGGAHIWPTQHRLP